MAPALILHFQVMPWAVVLLLGQFVKKVAHTLQSHIVVVKIEVQRKVGIGSLQVHVEQAVDGGLYLGGIILTNLGVHSNKELSSKSDGWPW